MSKEHQKSSINWGGVTNTLLATGAIVGGLILVAPGTMQGLADSISGIFTGKDAALERLREGITNEVKGDNSIAEAARQAEIDKRLKEALEAAKPNMVERGVGAVTAFIGKGIGSLIAKVAGGVIAVMGLNYLVNGKSSGDNHAQEHAERFAEQKEAFAVREDIRRMQAVMVARMQAAGHEPAMSGAPQRG